MKYRCKDLKSLVLLATSAISGNHSTTEVKYIQNPGQININCIQKPQQKEVYSSPNLKYTFLSIHGHKYYIKVSTRKIQVQHNKKQHTMQLKEINNHWSYSQIQHNNDLTILNMQFIIMMNMLKALVAQVDSMQYQIDKFD